VSWAAHIEHTAGGLAITFAEPLSRLDMTADVAAHLASLLAVEARQRMTGVVRTLEAENGSHAVERSQKRLYIGSADTSSHPLCCDRDPCLNGEHP
jgi:hypothetical protein